MLGLTAIAAFAFATATAGAARAEAPTNTALPSVSGTAVEGQTLTAAPGSWSGTTPISFSYVWQLCDSSGRSCERAPGAEGSTHLLGGEAVGKTVRVVVSATNPDGVRSAHSAVTGLVAAATPTTTAATTTAPTTTSAAPPPPAANGCKTSGASIPVADVAAPAELAIDQTQISPSTVTFATRSVTVRVHVSACGGSVAGALIYLTAVPYGQFGTTNEQSTGADGWATVQLSALAGFPVSPKQQLLVIFVRATAPGESVLGGISARRLVSFRVAHS